MSKQLGNNHLHNYFKMRLHLLKGFKPEIAMTKSVGPSPEPYITFALIKAKRTLHLETWCNDLTWNWKIVKVLRQIAYECLTD